MTSSRFAPALIVLIFCGTALAGCASDDAAPAATPPAQTADNGDLLAHPGNLLDDIHHAQMQRAQHDLEGATRTLSQLMLMAPDDPRVVGEYGKVLAERGRAQEATEFLTRATQLKSNDWSVYSALGVAEDQLGREDEAREAYEQALALKPNEPSVLNNYALSRLLAHDPAAARRLIAMAVAHGGGSDPEIARNVALIDSVAPQAETMQPVAQNRPVMQKRPEAHSMPKTIASHALAPVAPHVVMEAVPYDSKAGPVARAEHHRAHRVAAKKAPHVRHVAVRKAEKTPVKAAEKSPVAKPVAAKPVARRALAEKSAPPALRMTADASVP